jgi:hypothetical protein
MVDAEKKFLEFLYNSKAEQFTYLVKKYKELVKNSYVTSGSIEPVGFSDDIFDELEKLCPKEFVIYSNITNFIGLMEINPADWMMNGLLFESFDELSNLLQKSNLNTKEKLDIIMLFVKRNCDRLNNGGRNCIINADDILDLKFKNMNQKEFHDFISNGSLLKLLNQENESLTSEELEFKKEVIRRAHNRKETNSLVVSMKAIYRNYFLPINDLSEKNIMITKKALLVLKTDQALCDSIEYYLKKKMQKQNDEKKKTSVSCEVKKNENKNVMSVKEQNKIYRSIMSMYNIDLQRAIKPLNLEEIIYLVSLMVKLNIPDKEIMTSLKNIYKSYSIIYENPFIEFNAYYEKMVYLSDNEDISKAIQDIKDYMSLIFIPDNNKEYVDSKKEIKMTIDKVKPILASNLDYELEKGHSINKL